MVAAPRPSRPATVLLTGFDPFGGDALNPSWEIARALHRRQIAGHRVLAAQLPTVFGASLARLDELLAAHRAAAGASALGNTAGFLRNATFEGPGR